MSERMAGVEAPFYRERGGFVCKISERVVGCFDLNYVPSICEQRLLCLPNCGIDRNGC